MISRMAEEVKRKLRFKQYIYNQKQKKIAHLCIYSSPGKCLTITSVGYRPLRAGVEGEEAKVENEEAEAAEGDRVAGDPSRLCPSVRPGDIFGVFSDGGRARMGDGIQEPGSEDDTARQGENSAGKMNHSRAGKVSEAP